MNQINIEIAYALPDRYYLKSFKVDEGTMIQAEQAKAAQEKAQQEKQEKE